MRLASADRPGRRGGRTSASSRASTHASSCSRCSPLRRRNSPSSSSESWLASSTNCARSNAVQSCGLFGSAGVGAGGVEGGLVRLTPMMLAASRSHRDNVGCGIPVSSASVVALTAVGPTIRRTIRAFTFAAYSIGRFRSRPQEIGHQVEAATTLTQGERAQSGLIVTTSRVEPGAKQVCHARGYAIEAVERPTLHKWVHAMRTPGAGGFIEAE